jgi:hypothetical protein
MIAILTRVREKLSVILICISFMDKDAERLSVYLLAICISFENCLLNSLALLLTALFVPLVFNSLHSGYILDIESLSDRELAKIFSNSVGCLDSGHCFL